MLKDLSCFSLEELGSYISECHEKKLDSEILRASEELFSRFEENSCDTKVEKNIKTELKANKWFTNLYLFIVPVLYVLKVGLHNDNGFEKGEITILIVTTVAALMIYSVSVMNKRNS
jgi:hypothetical protein